MASVIHFYSNFLYKQFDLAFWIIGSQIVFISIFFLLKRSILPNICAASLSCLLFQCSSCRLFQLYPTRVNGFPFLSIFSQPLLTFFISPRTITFRRIQLPKRCVSANSYKDEDNSQLHTKYCTSSLISKIQTDNFRVTLTDRLDFHIVDNLSIALNLYLLHVLTSLSLDEILLPRALLVNILHLQTVCSTPKISVKTV